MSRSMYCDAKCYIDGKEIPYLSKASVVFSGNNKLNSLNATFNTPDLETHSLYNKKVEFYLNESTVESVPYFTGYIKDINPSPSDVKIKALDPRTFLSGKEAKTISISDEKNYDGYTLVQFLYDVVSDKRIPMGVEHLRETSIPILMKGERGDVAPYDLIQKKIKKLLNDKTLEKPKNFNIDVSESEHGPQIKIREKLSIDEVPSLRLSYVDGIRDLSYNKRAVPSYGVAKVKGKGNSKKTTKSGEFQDGNMPLGYRGIKVSGDFKDTDTAKYYAMLEVYSGKDKGLDISVDSNKGFKTPLGSIVYLDVDDLKIRGNHLLVSKRCNWSDGTVKLKLSLGRPAPVVSDYI